LTGTRGMRAHFLWFAASHRIASNPACRNTKVQRKDHWLAVTRSKSLESGRMGLTG
jgi:hypothetical protein